jgi:hypothetical protein
MFNSANLVRMPLYLPENKTGLKVALEVQVATYQ